MNIYSLYISFSKQDVQVFKNIFQKVCQNIGMNNLLIFHLDLSKRNKLTIFKFEYAMIHDSNYKIKSVRELVSLYQTLSKWKKEYKKNIFIYSGHFDGILIAHHRMYVMSLDDLSILIQSIKGKKMDLFVADTCLLGSINALEKLRSCTKYVLASPSYNDYLSFLETKSFYQSSFSIVQFAENLVKEMLKMYTKVFTEKSFMIHFCLYHLNPYLNQLIELVQDNKHLFQTDKKDICAMNGKDYYYTDLKCTLFKNNMDVSKLIQKIIIHNDYFDIGQNRYCDLILILDKPYDHFTYQDPFFD